MKLNRKQLRKLIESVVYEGVDNEKFSKAYAIRIAKDLDRAMHGRDAASFLLQGLASLGTDEERIGRIFKAMNNSVMKLTQVANYYRTMYDQNLADAIFSELNREELYTYIESNFDDGIQHLKDMAA